MCHALCLRYLYILKNKYEFVLKQKSIFSRSLRICIFYMINGARTREENLL